MGSVWDEKFPALHNAILYIAGHEYHEYDDGRRNDRFLPSLYLTKEIHGSGVEVRVDDLEVWRLECSWDEYAAHQSGSVVDRAAGLSLGVVRKGCRWKPLSMGKTHLSRSAIDSR